MGTEGTGDVPWSVSDGVPWLHADWPTYPMGDTWRSALVNFGSFPYGTAFAPISYIDKSILFRVLGFAENLDEYDERGFHVAVWDENLVDLSDRGLISLQGINFATRRKYEEFQRDIFRREMLENIASSGQGTPEDDPLDHLFFMFEGERVPFKLPPLESYDDDDPEEGRHADHTWVCYGPLARVQLTVSGVQKVEEIWAGVANIPNGLESKLAVLMEHRMYDTAIRELGVLLESQMRKATSSSAYGAKLANEFVDHLLAANQHDDWSLKVLRKELRTALKFVRNEFAHNIVELPRSRAEALIARMCHVLTQVESLSC